MRIFMLMSGTLQKYLAILIFLFVQGPADGQIITAVRIDGRPDTPGFDPIIDESTFTAVGSSSQANAGFNQSSLPAGSTNINGPSVIRVPDWIPAADRVHPDAKYYLYFGHHIGRDIRMAWSDSLTGTWSLFNSGDAPDRSWGNSGNNTGAQTPRSGVLSMVQSRLDAHPGSEVIATNHIASPEVHVDHQNQRIIMYFHATSQLIPGITGQQTFVSTSSYGLNFNPTHLGGEVGQGMREVLPVGAYARIFEVGGQTFAFSNGGKLWKAPRTNDVGEINTIANADTPGGLWKPSPDVSITDDNWWELVDQSGNPMQTLYAQNGEGTGEIRHSTAYTRTHIDPSDTNVYLFYSAKNDTPERIFLSVIDTNNGSTDTDQWKANGQQLILQAELDWEGADLPATKSANGAQVNVNQLRDPFIFEDDGKVYLFYTGEGEEAIGFAELRGFSSSP
ncbi:hypothetical protein [Planctomycetes bacterium TBK1r]|uniref:hypothetical protein n=1 Tax=Stieleria magnilauensis TaxID=2527963 RepID=UPI0011AA2A16